MFNSIKNKYLRAILDFAFTFVASYAIMWVLFSIVASIIKRQVFLCPLFMAAPAALSLLGSLFATFEDIVGR